MSDVLTQAIDFLSMASDDEYITIYFIKKNGEKRLMKATLNFKNIPKNKHPKGYNLKNILQKIRTANILTVFDLEKNDWRNIKLDKIIWVKSANNKTYEFKIPMSSFQNIGI